MTLNEITSIAKVLARKYNNHQEFDDLVQEGTLVALEVLANGGDSTQAIGAMRKQMFNYINLSMKPVHIPPSGSVSRLLSALKSQDGATPSGTTEVALYEALVASPEGIEPHTLREDKSSEDIVVEKDTVEYIRNNLWVYLTPREAVTLDMIYFEEYTTGEVAKKMGVTHQAVSGWEANGIKKLRGSIEALEQDS